MNGFDKLLEYDVFLKVVFGERIRPSAYSVSFYLIVFSFSIDMKFHLATFVIICWKFIKQSGCLKSYYNF